jgi:hypothetical protein
MREGVQVPVYPAVRGLFARRLACPDPVGVRRNVVKAEVPIYFIGTKAGRLLFAAKPKRNLSLRHNLADAIVHSTRIPAALSA